MRRLYLALIFLVACCSYAQTRNQMDINNQTKNTLQGSRVGIATTSALGTVKAPNCTTLGANYVPQSLNVDGTWNCLNVTTSGGGISGLTLNHVPKASSSTSIADSCLLENSGALDASACSSFKIGSGATTINITTMTIAQLLVISSPATGDQHDVSDGINPVDCGTGGGTYDHMCKWNGTSWVTGLGSCTGCSVTIASGSTALGTSAIASNACASVVTATAVGANPSTDNLEADFTADPFSITGYIPATGGSLSVSKYITSGNVNFHVCNGSGSSLTPAAATIRWSVKR